MRREAGKHLATLKLEVVAPEIESLARAVANQLALERRRVEITPRGALSRTLARRVRELVPGTTVAELKPGERLRGKLAVLLHESSQALASALLELVDLESGSVIVPRGERAGHRLALFLIAIPKAGTHLLIALAHALGYADGLELEDPPEPRHWYYVEYSNAHTAAPDFFVDTVRRSPFGNRHHPFPRNPALFIYRNPLDVLVSEAHYYHREGNAAFAAYLQQLDFEERMLRLVDDPWLLGSFRDRIGRFVAWLDFPNVIPLSFEELVGADGGGSDALQRKALWSLLLRLQVSGDVDSLARRLRARRGPTFREGRIGAHRELLTEKVRSRFAALPQDFMAAFGYAGLSARALETCPARAEDFRRRPLVLASEDFGATPILVERGFLGHDFVRFRGRYFAVPRGSGPVDLGALDDAALGAFPSAPRLAELRLYVSRSDRGPNTRRESCAS